MDKNEINNPKYDIGGQASRRTLLKGVGGLMLAGAGGMAAASTAEASSKSYRIMCYAFGHAGAPYVSGAKGPNTFDCSGLVQYSARQAGVSVPNNTWAQTVCNRISPRSGRTPLSRLYAVPGDLIFFYTSYGSAEHVGFYTSDHQIWDAYAPGYRVGKRPMSYYKRFATAQSYFIH